MSPVDTACSVLRSGPTRLDRPVLVAGLLSGALWLLVPAALGSWSLVAVAATYVVAASVFHAAVYARSALSVAQEAMAWTAPWLAAVALWTGVLARIEDAASGWLPALWPALLLGTGCYLAWQLTALAVRQLLAWRAGPDRRR